MSESNNTAVELHGNKNLPDNAFTKLPQTFEEAKKYCNYLASSALVPKAYQGKPQDVFVALSWGQEVGLSAMNSLRNIAVINGRASMWGDAPIAIVRSHPKCDFILEDNEAFAYARDNIDGWEHLEDVDPDSTSICVGKRVGEQAQAREFSVEDVKRAKLGNVHNQYPKDMRKYKARSRLIDSVFPDLVMGLGQAEIIEESVQLDEEGGAEAKSNNDGLANQVLDEVTSKNKKEKPEKEEDVQDAEYEEVDDDEEQEEAEEDTGPKLASDKDVKYLLEYSKYLPKEDQDKLSKEATDDITDESAQQWKEKIREAHQKLRKKQEAKKAKQED